MTGFIYRRAIDLKDFGERIDSGFFIRLGLALKDWVSKYPVKYFGAGRKTWRG
jgi:hypothetical protein